MFGVSFILHVVWVRERKLGIQVFFLLLISSIILVCVFNDWCS